MKMSYPVRVAICGLGSRGKDTYAPISEILPEQMVIAAIAEPIEEKREYVRKRYNVPAQMCFETGEEMFARERLADVALICTQDAMHVGHAVAALEKGYHLLLEKPEPLIVRSSAMVTSPIAFCALFTRFSLYTEAER